MTTNATHSRNSRIMSPTDLMMFTIPTLCMRWVGSNRKASECKLHQTMIHIYASLIGVPWHWALMKLYLVKTIEENWGLGTLRYIFQAIVVIIVIVIGKQIYYKGCIILDSLANLSMINIHLLFISYYLGKLFPMYVRFMYWVFTRYQVLVIYYYIVRQWYIYVCMYVCI